MALARGVLAVRHRVAIGAHPGHYEAVGDLTGGFGSVRVEVTVGETVWRTSLFPSAEAGAYVLPVKKAVRVAEGLADDAVAEVTIRLVER